MQIESKWSNHQQAECGPAWLWGHFCNLQPLRDMSGVMLLIASGVVLGVLPCRGEELTPEHEKFGLNFKRSNRLRNFIYYREWLCIRSFRILIWWWEVRGYKVERAHAPGPGKPGWEGQICHLLAVSPG